MQPAQIPLEEDARLARLAQYRILDTPPEESFDRITRIVAQVIGVPIALVSLIDRDRQWFKSRVGLDAQETPREIAFCAHAILGDDVFVVEDATLDPRFATNPLVLEAPAIRFYAGAPLRAPGGYKLGTICAIDTVPHKMTAEQMTLLRDLSAVVVDQMELRLALRGSLGELAEEARLSALKDEFVSAVSHELRTPLTSIKGALGLLSGGIIDGVPEAARDLISRADRNADNLTVLVDDLLDFRTYEAGELTFDFENVDLCELAVDISNSIAALGRSRNITARMDIPPASAMVLGDGHRLTQVLNKLVSNAVKFSPDGGEVVVTINLCADAVRLSVTDFGDGIPEAFRGRVFDRFTQATLPDRPNGTGLGLAICKTIVEAHNGRIGFESEANGGTTFFFELPLHHSLIQ